MKKNEIKLSDLKMNPDNPRTISPDQLEKLKTSIKEFKRMFEMRPIIIDEDNVVLGGNMRLLALKELGYKSIPEAWIKKIETLTDDQKKEFIIKDNISFGKWDWDLLAKDKWDYGLMDKWGFDEFEDKKKIDKAEEGETIEVEKSIQIEPPKEYIIIIADPNSEEWENMKEMLKLKIVRKGGYKKGSPFDSVGLERVLNWKDLKKRMNHDNSNSK